MSADRSVQGTSDPDEAPLIELEPRAKPYLLKVGDKYVKILTTPAADDDPEPSDPPHHTPVGAETRFPFQRVGGDIVFKLPGE